MANGTELMVPDRDEEVSVGGLELATMDGQSRGMIDLQIATAKRYPRSIKRFMDRATQLATYNPDIAGQCTYAKPIGGNKFAVGPSVRLAEIVSQTWGNMRASARVVEETDRYLIAQGECIDLETNFAVQINVRRRIIDKQGRIYSEGVIETNANAAVSIAYRNAVFRVVPRSLVEQVRMAAAEVANGGESFEIQREKWIAYWAGKGVEERRLCSALGLAGRDDLTVEHMELLRALASAVKQGETTVDEAFPSLALAVSAPTPSASTPGDPVAAAWERHNAGKASRTEALAETLKQTNGSTRANGASEPPRKPSREPGEEG